MTECFRGGEASVMPLFPLTPLLVVVMEAILAYAMMFLKGMIV
jgi:hypothetical protein